MIPNHALSHLSRKKKLLKCLIKINSALKVNSIFLVKNRIMLYKKRKLKLSIEYRTK